MSSIVEIKDRMAKCQEELKSANDMLLQLKLSHLQLKESCDKVYNNIKETQSRIDTFSGAVQAFDLALKAMEVIPSVVPNAGEIA